MNKSHTLRQIYTLYLCRIEYIFLCHTDHHSKINKFFFKYKQSKFELSRLHQNLNKIYFSFKLNLVNIKSFVDKKYFFIEIKYILL